MANLARIPNDRILRLPYRGAPSTVKVIIAGALEAQKHLVVRQLAEDICRDINAKDYLSEALAINYFMWANTRYMRDPRTVEFVKAPWLVCEEIISGHKPQLDCDDMSCSIIALLLATGCQCAAVTCAFKHMFFNGERQYSHVFAQAFEPYSRTSLVLDPVANVHTDSMLKRIVAAKVWPVSS